MRELAKLKVCFIAGTLGQGGAERQLFYILKALRESGTDVRLLSLTSGEFWEPHIQALGVPVTWVGRLESKLLRLHKILAVLREQPPDVVQSQHFYTNLYAVAAARVLGFCEIGAIRNDGKSDTRLNGPVLGRLSLHAPRLIAANSQAGIRNAIQMGVPARRLRLLANVVDCDQFCPMPRKEEQTIRLIVAGRLVKEKRVDRFLVLFSQLQQHLSVKLRAIIVGDGPLRSQLEQQALGMGLLPNVVQFRGKVADMSSVYREADILVLTSDYEGTPNVLLEAMASGLPVVATRVGGVPEVVRDGETGYLADPQNEMDMLGPLISLIQDRRLRIAFGHNARQYVVQNHSTMALTDSLKAIYSVALSGNHPRSRFQTQSHDEVKGTA